MTFYQALALDDLGKGEEAWRRLTNRLNFAAQQQQAKIKLEYFTTSLPNFLLFDDDLVKRNWVECAWPKGLAYLGLGRVAEAVSSWEEAVRLDHNQLDALY